MKVVVIGGGPGGYVSAIRLAQLGAEVVLIEKNKIGGTCLNVGCIPTKVLLHTAEIFRTMKKEGEELGVKAENLKLDWQTLQDRKINIVNQLVEGIETLIKSNMIKKIIGTGKFIGKNKIQVTSPDGRIETIVFDKAVIATGSRPKKVPIPRINEHGVITSTEALQLESIPKSICIIGGGVIGCEFASIYRAFGVDVTIVEALPDLIGTMDIDIVNVLKEQFTEDEISIHVNTKVEAIKASEDGLIIQVSTPNGKEEIQSEKVLLSIGRTPIVEDIGLEEIGVKIEKGAITVDRRTMQTSVENIYAVGDCNGGILLAHVASSEGVLAAESIMGKKPSVNFKAIPSGVYTKPELASVGLNELEAKTKGYQVKVGVFPLYANGKSLIMGEEKGVVKFVVDSQTDEILGMHMAGPRATDLIVEGALALRLEATIDEIISTIHGHPTIGEALHEAAHAVHSTAIHLPKY
ncbi:dihydrolipoyl dehydrogenase [Tissierella sp. MSJ-40]|uniref:Dihydrolipoyl dehydrogenase n=1 Tax=Tissierella simiarum TaxID=2841534 RepID=A0ABS6E3R5_9FIRM|nr:dihydrolipoyl dehydrogenase [Tissierella simiarum]MBU5437427.1 dihydrolipoyl dehydrogenase [Tissierella simiarum]